MHRFLRTIRNCHIPGCSGNHSDTSATPLSLAELSLYYIWRFLRTIGISHDSCCYGSLVAMATTFVPQKLHCLELYQVHIRHEGFLGQQRSATDLTCVVAWLSWQPKRHFNKSFIFSSYFKGS